MEAQNFLNSRLFLLAIQSRFIYVIFSFFKRKEKETLNPIDNGSKIPDKSTFKDQNVNIEPSSEGYAKGKIKFKRSENFLKKESCNGSNKLPRKNFSNQLN